MINQFEVLPTVGDVYYHARPATHHDAGDAVDAEHDTVVQRVVGPAPPRSQKRAAHGVGGDDHLLVVLSV